MFPCCSSRLFLVVLCVDFWFLTESLGLALLERVINKARKTQKAAGGEAFLLSCRPITWQPGNMPAGLVRKPWACITSRWRPPVWSGAMPTKLIRNRIFFFHGVEENLIPFQLWRDPLGFWAEMRLRSKYLVLAESSAQFGFKLLVITDFQLQIAHRFLVLPQGRFLCSYANHCFRIADWFSDPTLRNLEPQLWKCKFAMLPALSHILSSLYDTRCGD